ncbi:MAG: ADOP family duplicated permease [Gemmatimonadaceae bacterium]
MTRSRSWFATIRGWARALLTRSAVEDDLSEEISFHLEMETEKYRRTGLAPEAARRAARIALGSVDGTREGHRDARGTRVLEDAIADTRYAARWLRRTPSFTVSAVLTLALGIGANVAIFSVVDAIILRPLPYPRPEQLLSLGSGSAGEFLALRERLRGFSQLGAYATQTHPIDDGRQALRIEGAAITTSVLSLLGVSPQLGRGFIEEDGIAGNNAVLLISDGLWKRQFGATPDVVGRRVLLEGVPHTIIGVMPPDFHFPSRTIEYWQPGVFNTADLGATWAIGDKSLVGRIAPGVTVEQAQRQVREVWPTLRKLNPLWDPGESYRREVAPKPLQAEVIGASGRVVWLLFGCVLLVLLIGCVNVANLLLARATAREREFAVRAALGGGRGRLVRQLVTESLLISAIGSVLGVAIALLALRWLINAMPTDVPRAHEISVNGTVLAFTTLLTVITGVLFGVIPALRATTAVSGTTSITSVGGGRRATHGIAHHRVSGALVAAEMALAVLLVIGATLLARSFSALRRVDPGFHPEQVIAARVSPPGASYNDPGRTSALYLAVLERMAGLPGVQRVSAVDKLPLAQSVWGISPRIQGQFEDATHSLPTIGHYQQVTPGYFATLDIPLKQGRVFTDADGADSPPVTVVTESVARRFWPSGGAIGHRVGYPWKSPWLTIVGVVADTKQDSLRDTVGASMYVPWQQRTRMSGNEMWVLARTSGDPVAIAAQIRAIVREVDRTVPVSDVRTMGAVLSASVQRARFTVMLVGAFAFAALLLGAIGIYGVMSYLVGQRTREMGIRLALGAPLGGVTRLVVGEAATLAAAGAVVGVVAAMFATRLLGSMLYEVSATDPLTFVLVPTALIGVALAASAVPARRATRVDPVRALRAE